MITLKALTAVCLVLMAMTPQMMAAFGQIAGAEIVSGIIDLETPLTGTVYATGKTEGQLWDITAEWVNGYPRLIRFTNPRSKL